MNEKIEEAAEALWRAEPAHTPMRWSDCVEEFREIKRRQARAVMLAMREPTKGMVVAADPDGLVETDFAFHWQAMIDEALR